MAQITYENKVALDENPNVNAINKVRDVDMNEIKEVVNDNETKVLLAVSSSAPATCDTGDIYFNTTTNLLYTATATNTWGSTGIAPTSNTIYLELTNQTAYAYDGTTLVSVGGGAGGDSTPIGTIEAYSGNTAPNGYLLCDGSAVSRTTYSDLFDVIGTTYGTGDGSTTFNLPNLKGRTVVMLDSTQTEFDTLGETGGSKYLQAHQHQFSVVKDNDNTNSLGDGAKACNNTGQNSGVNTSKTSGNVLTSDGNNTLTTGNSGNLQPYIVLNYIIKANKISEVPTTATVQNVSSNSTTDAYSCDYQNKAFGGTLLWTNPNPTSSFTAQNIQLSSSDYDIYECIYAISSGVIDRYLSSKSVKGKGFILEFYDGYEKKGGTRSISYTDATHLAVQQSYYDGTGSTTYCIPEYIIGYKTGLFN